MPVYEYRCEVCGQKASFLARSFDAQVEAVCPDCGSREMRRLFSVVSFRFASRGAAGDPSLDYYRDPSNIGRHAEESFKKYGVDMPESVRKAIDRARQGKMPEGLDL